MTPDEAAEAYRARVSSLVAELIPAAVRVRSGAERHRVVIGITCPRVGLLGGTIEVFECTSRLAFQVDPDVEGLARSTVCRLRAELEARGARVA
jgi:hypothetical protein